MTQEAWEDIFIPDQFYMNCFDVLFYFFLHFTMFSTMVKKGLSCKVCSYVTFYFDVLSILSSQFVVSAQPAVFSRPCAPSIFLTNLCSVMCSVSMCLLTQFKCVMLWNARDILLPYFIGLLLYWFGTSLQCNQHFIVLPIPLQQFCLPINSDLQIPHKLPYLIKPQEKLQEIHNVC